MGSPSALVALPRTPQGERRRWTNCPAPSPSSRKLGAATHSQDPQFTLREAKKLTAAMYMPVLSDTTLYEHLVGLQEGLRDGEPALLVFKRKGRTAEDSLALLREARSGKLLLSNGQIPASAETLGSYLPERVTVDVSLLLGAFADHGKLHEAILSALHAAIISNLPGAEQAEDK
ncbi:MAG: hypothetical protein WC901_01550 [Candidatus Margulisiibacteriota bacterium]